MRSMSRSEKFLVGKELFQQTKHCMLQAIILGAGASKFFTKNTANIPVDCARTVLDWQIDAFSGKDATFTFVGGSQIEHLSHEGSDVHFVFNPQWESSSCAASLRLSGFDANTQAFVCYADVLFRRSLVDQMLAESRDDGGIVVAVDLDLSLLKTKEDYETICIDKIHYPFVGCVYFRPQALKILKENACFCDEVKDYRLSEVVRCLQKRNCNVRFLDVHGLWTEVLSPKEVAKFVLTTKAQTLHTLQGKVTKAHILEQVCCSVRQWRENPQAVLEDVLKHFGSQTLVVRSSSLREDGFVTANAGKFESLLNIQPTSEALRQAIDAVIASYGNQNSADQVLIQPMLHNVKLSGVIFTRTLTYGAPYHVVNYAQKDTAAVTSGFCKSDETFYHWKYSKIPSNAPNFYPKLFEAVREIETLVQFDALDIEFAVTDNDELYVFQVRPIASQKLREVTDESLRTYLADAEQRFADYQVPHPDVRGKETIFGVMPDWNPAEIVGTKPHRLAISLYQSLITNAIWAQQRAEFGYKDVRPYPLIVNFVGHPYVDVRASVHSFLPNVLSDETTEKLVDYFVGRLKQNPAWHDKLEFMVMPTCYTVDFEERWRELLTTEAGLSEKEFLTYKDALLTLTKNAFEICERCYAEMQTIERRFDRIDASDLKPLDKIYVLLKTCCAGTLNFSHLARCGFIASSFLKSFVAKGLLTEEEKMQITGGIKTVTGQFFDTVRKVLSGEISKEACIRMYGHLRPGTYDITSPAYHSDPDKYLFPIENTGSNRPQSERRYVAGKNPERTLRETFGISWDAFYRFISHAVAGREYSKFVFTRYISKILDLIKAIGEEYGFDVEAMSHVPVGLFEDIRNGLCIREDTASLLKTVIRQGREYNLMTLSIELPPLITKAEDFYAFFIPKTLPNFIGNGKIEAEVVYLEHSKTTDGSLLSGKIVLIEQADPGFDWIFNYNIGGLITAYGGPNSHMAIRASEFNLPTSIGVGESLFNQLKFARLVRLDCAAHQLTVLG